VQTGGLFFLPLQCLHDLARRNTCTE